MIILKLDVDSEETWVPYAVDLVGKTTTHVDTHVTTFPPHRLSRNCDDIVMLVVEKKSEDVSPKGAEIRKGGKK